MAISFGLLALVLSIYNPISASEPSPGGITPSDLPELVEESQTSQLKAATVPEPGQAATASAPAPNLPRAAAPIEALPASRVRSVTTDASVRSNVTSSSSPSSSAYKGPLSVSLVALGGAAAEEVTARAADLLRESGRDVNLTGLDEVGRSEVLLVLDSLGTSVQAWYCDPGPAGNAALAKQLMEGMPAPSTPADAPDPDLASKFSCEDVHAGRAQTAAVLLEIAQADTAAAEETAAAVSKAVNSYLDQHATALRQARGKTSLIWPAIGPLTSYFGPSHPLGIDIGQWEGPIVASMAGKVLFAGGDPCCSYGLYVVIESAGGIHMVYGHLESLSVRTEQTVKQGQVLGPVGCTGHCSGNHLHFEVWQNGVRVDPMRYLP